jgi:hypothetical protein
MTLKRWALISGNTVVNIVDQEDQPFVYTEDGKFWVEDPEKLASPNPAGCTTYDNGVFVNTTLLVSAPPKE